MRCDDEHSSPRMDEQSYAIEQLATDENGIAGGSLMNRDQRICIERFVNFFLRFPWTVFIFSRDMQHQRRT